MDERERELLRVEKSRIKWARMGYKGREKDRVGEIRIKRKRVG